MKKIIFLALLIMLLPFSVYSTGLTYYNDFSNASDFFLVSGACEITTGAFHEVFSGANFYNAVDCRLVHNLTKTLYGSNRNFTLNMRLNWTNRIDTADRSGFGFYKNNASPNVAFSQNIFLTSGSTSNTMTFCKGYPSVCSPVITSAVAIPTMRNVSMYFNTSASGFQQLNLYEESAGIMTFVGSTETTSAEQWAFLGFPVQSGIEFWIDDITMCNSTGVDFGCSQAQFVFTPDVTAPAVTINNPTPANNSVVSNNIIIFNLTIVEDNLDDIVFNLNGTNETNTFTNTFGNVWTLTKVLMSEGTRSWSVFVNDTSGNIFRSGTYSFTLDSIAPTITFNYPSPSNTTSTERTGNLNITLNNINVTFANLTILNSSNQAVYTNIQLPNSTSFTYTDSIATIWASQPDAVYRVSACGRDFASNQGCKEALITITTAVIVATPNPYPLGVYDTLSESGNGIGVFLNAITHPLGGLIFYISIIGGVIALLGALIFIIRKVTNL